MIMNGSKAPCGVAFCGYLKCCPQNTKRKMKGYMHNNNYGILADIRGEQISEDKRQLIESLVETAHTKLHKITIPCLMAGITVILTMFIFLAFWSISGFSIVENLISFYMIIGIPILIIITMGFDRILTYLKVYDQQPDKFAVMTIVGLILCYLPSLFLLVGIFFLPLIVLGGKMRVASKKRSLEMVLHQSCSSAEQLANKTEGSKLNNIAIVCFGVGVIFLLTIIGFSLSLFLTLSSGTETGLGLLAGMFLMLGTPVGIALAVTTISRLGRYYARFGVYPQDNTRKFAIFGIVFCFLPTLLMVFLVLLILWALLQNH